MKTDPLMRSLKQHVNPCADCPWRRKAIPGWLGGFSAQYWLSAAHSDVLVLCHTAKKDHQCAGMAIYRANVCKQVARPILSLGADKQRVFSNPIEFFDHHKAERAIVLPFGLTDETRNALATGKVRQK